VRFLQHFGLFELGLRTGLALLFALLLRLLAGLLSGLPRTDEQHEGEQGRRRTRELGRADLQRFGHAATPFRTVGRLELAPVREPRLIPGHRAYNPQYSPRYRLVPRNPAGAGPARPAGRGSVSYTCWRPTRAARGGRFP